MSGELISIQEQPVQTAQPITPMSLIQLALQNNSAIDVIERLAALQKDQNAHDAEMAFNAALNRAQAEMGPVGADLNNPQTKSKYASYQALDRRVRPIYTREGLALSFDTADSPLEEHVRIVCYVSHASGHTRTYRVDMPNDGKGAKGGDVMTKTHAQGAALSYGKRYLLILIFNIAVGEDDNDGNGFGMPEEEFQGHLRAMREAKDVPSLATAYEKAKMAARNDKPTYLAIVKVKDECKAKLRGAQ